MICIPVLLVGGTENQTLTLAKLLIEAGYRVIVCCYCEYELNMVSQFQTIGAEVILMKYDMSKGLWHLTKDLIAYFKKKKSDIVHVQYIAPGFIPILAAKLAGVKTIFATVHQPVTPYGVKAKLLLRAAATLCTTFFCNSLAVEKSWFGNAELYRSESAKLRRHFTIYNAVDTVAIGTAVSGADRTALRLQMGLGDGPVVGIVARLRWEKGHALLLNAFPKVLMKFPDAQLLIFGDGPDKELLAQLAEDLKITNNVHWAGQQSSNEVYKLYSVMDIVAVPSVFEGFGLVAAEAMAAGLPVVGTNVGGLAEVIEDGKTGYLVPPGNSMAIADALVQLLSDPEMAVAMGNRGQVRARQQFSMEQFGQTILSAYMDFARQ